MFVQYYLLNYSIYYIFQLIFFFQIEDLKKIHYSICPEHEHHDPIIQLSLDGILESKSSFTSLDVYSLAFHGCRSIYPIRIIRPCNRYKYDEQKQLQEVLAHINDNHLIIDSCILDNLKRAIIRCAKNHAGKFACEYCFNSAVIHVDLKKKAMANIEKRFQVQENILSQQLSQLPETQESDSESVEAQALRDQLDALNEEKLLEIQKTGRKHLTWPASTMNGNLRTLENVTAIVEEIESNPNILKNDPDFCKGFKGKSLFLNQPNFHFIDDITTEYMHLVCLGVVKRLLSLTFSVGETRERITRRKLSSPKLYNDQIQYIQVFRECSRRCRSLDYGVMKAAEFRNVLIFFFPIVLNCIPDEFSKEKELWLHLVFMIRGCLVPNEEFPNVDKSHIESACKNFYLIFEELFGQNNCSYSIHVVPSHLLQMRGDNPLTSRSAFKFETFFSEMRHLFQAGTASTVKQVLQNCYVKRMLEYHHCQKQTFYSAKKKPKPGKPFNPGKEDNSLIYTLNENKKITVYSIVEKISEHEFLCNQQGIFSYKMPLVPHYNWSSVGVFKQGPISEEVHKIKAKYIKGKVMKVQNLLITCPLNVLHEN